MNALISLQRKGGRLLATSSIYLVGMEQRFRSTAVGSLDNLLSCASGGAAATLNCDLSRSASSIPTSGTLFARRLTVASTGDCLWNMKIKKLLLASPADPQAQFKGISSKKSHWLMLLSSSQFSSSSAASSETMEDSQCNTNSTFSDKQFSSLSNISKESKRAINEVFKFDYMTKVQAATLPCALGGKDLLAKAKTGTGKTIAFMLPIIEHIVMAKAKMSKQRKQQENPILAVILAPTRELTLQIASETKDLIRFQNDIKIVTMIGGTNINTDKKRLGEVVDIIIATPGRFQDHLNQNTAYMNERIMNGLICLCLDEADRLLDMGFRNELTRILSCMPKSRQTLLFSATLPNSLTEIKKIALKPDYEMINTISEGDINTNAQVVQEYVICPIESQVAMLESMLRQYQLDCSGEEGYKAIVFFNTARTAAFMSDIFRSGGFPILEMHSRKSQSYRTKCAKEFTERTNVILFSSDVSARGVDYPGVTLVVQVGLTERDQYIHRLGRTARAGREGRGIILLSDFEKFFVQKELNDLEISQMPIEVGKALGSARSSNNEKNLLANIEKNEALKTSAEKAYQAFLGYYNSNLRRLRMSKAEVVKLANSYSAAIGLQKIPALEARTIGLMGLKGTPGLVVGANVSK